MEQSATTAFSQLKSILSQERYERLLKLKGQHIVPAWTSWCSFKSEDATNKDVEFTVLRLYGKKLVLEYEMLQEKRQRISAERCNVALRTDIMRLRKVLADKDAKSANKVTKSISSLESLSQVQNISNVNSTPTFTPSEPLSYMPPYHVQNITNNATITTAVPQQTIIISGEIPQIQNIAAAPYATVGSMMGSYVVPYQLQNISDSASLPTAMPVLYSGSTHIQNVLNSSSIITNTPTAAMPYNVQSRNPGISITTIPITMADPPLQNQGVATIASPVTIAAPSLTVPSNAQYHLKHSSNVQLRAIDVHSEYEMNHSSNRQTVPNLSSAHRCVNSSSTFNVPVSSSANTIQESHTGQNSSSDVTAAKASLESGSVTVNTLHLRKLLPKDSTFGSTGPTVHFKPPVTGAQTVLKETFLGHTSSPALLPGQTIFTTNQGQTASISLLGQSSSSMPPVTNSEGSSCTPAVNTLQNMNILLKSKMSHDSSYSNLPLKQTNRISGPQSPNLSKHESPTVSSVKNTPLFVQTDIQDEPLTIKAETIDEPLPVKAKTSEVSGRGSGDVQKVVNSQLAIQSSDNVKCIDFETAVSNSVSRVNSLLHNYITSEITEQSQHIYQPVQNCDDSDDPLSLNTNTFSDNVSTMQPFIPPQHESPAVSNSAHPVDPLFMLTDDDDPIGVEMIDLSDRECNNDIEIVFSSQQKIKSSGNVKLSVVPAPQRKRKITLNLVHTEKVKEKGPKFELPNDKDKKSKQSDYCIDLT